MHPNQMRGTRAAVSRAARPPGPWQRMLRTAPRITPRATPLRSWPWPAAPDRVPPVLPPSARPRRAARRPQRLDVLARCANYAEQSARTGAVKTSLTGPQRKRVASKAKLSPAQRADL